MRAVPRSRRASTNRVRLMPYPAKPTIAAAATAEMEGTAAPMRMPAMTLTLPAINPLVQAMTVASHVDALRVRLLSIAQQRHARATSGAPGENEILPGDHESTNPPMTIKAMPAAMLRSRFSRNANQAMRAVNTASRFRSKALTDAAVDVRPTISSTGPNTPPNRMEPDNQPMSRPRGQTIFLKE